MGNLLFGRTAAPVLSGSVPGVLCISPLDSRRIWWFYYSEVNSMKRDMAVFTKTSAIILICLSLVSCAVIAGENEPEGVSSTTEMAQTYPYDRFSEGKPNFDLRTRGGIYIWRNGDFWHFRAARRMDRPRAMTPLGPVIAGSVTMKNANAVDMRKFQMSPVSTAVMRRDLIKFRIEQRDDIGKEIEGFDFRVRPIGLEYCVTFTITTDGVPKADEIYLGSFMQKAEELPLTICLHSSFRPSGSLRTTP